MALTRSARKVAAIRRKLPRELDLPAAFPAFADLVTHPKDRARDLMNLTWSDPRPLLNVDRSAAKACVPFLLLADGGVVAFWIEGTDLRVVTCDSEGQFAVLARNFHDFVARLTTPDAALRERLELEGPLDTRPMGRMSKPRPVPASIQTSFTQWVAHHALDAKTPQTASLQSLRDALHALARRMLEDGLSKVYTAKSPHWTKSFLLSQSGGGWKVTYLDYGKWRPVPAKYGFAKLLPALLAAMKSRKKTYELNVWQDGRVFADRGNQLSIDGAALP